MKNKFFFGAAAQALLLLAFISCEKFPVVDDSEVPSPVSLEELARMYLLETGVSDEEIARLRGLMERK